MSQCLRLKIHLHPVLTEVFPPCNTSGPTGLVAIFFRPPPLGSSVPPGEASRSLSSSSVPPQIPLWPHDALDDVKAEGDECCGDRGFWTVGSVFWGVGWGSAFHPLFYSMAVDIVSWPTIIFFVVVPRTHK